MKNTYRFVLGERMITNLLTRALQKYSIMELILPFLVIYTIMYSLLRKTRVLGPPQEANFANAVVAFAIAAIVVFFTPFGITFIEFFSKIFTSALIISLSLILLIVFAVLIGAAKGGGERSWFVIILASVLVFFALKASGIMSLLAPYAGVTGIPIEPLVVIAIVGAMILIFYALFYQPQPKQQKQEK